MTEGDMWNKDKNDLPRIEFPSDITGPIVAYRFWYPNLVNKFYWGWSSQRLMGLCSVAVSYLWKPGINQAEDRSGDLLFFSYPGSGVAPQGRLGFYGLKEVTPKTYGILGLALYWGNVQIHKNGLRAEYAQPLALIRNRSWPYLDWPGFEIPSDRLDQFAKQYGIPIVDEESAKKIIEEWNGGGST